MATCKALDLKIGDIAALPRGDVKITYVIDYGSAVSIIGQRRAMKSVEYIYRDPAKNWLAPEVRTKQVEVDEEVFLDLPPLQKVLVKNR